MNETTPEHQQGAEPQGTAAEEPRSPDPTREHTQPAGGEDPTREHPSAATADADDDPTREYPQAETGDPTLAFTREYPRAETSADFHERHQAPLPPLPSASPSQTAHQRPAPAAPNTAAPQPADPRLAASPAAGHLPTGSGPVSPHASGPIHHSGPTHQPGPTGHSGPVPQPADPRMMRTPGPRPPRRRGQDSERLASAPVTGTMPLSDVAVTDIPPEGPIDWPPSRVGFVGVANLFLSAILAVVWAWIPLGLLFTGIGGIFALGLGVLALVAWVFVQRGANIAERFRAELIYGDRIPVPKVARSTKENGFTRFLHNQWLLVRSASFWRSTVHHYAKLLLGAIVVTGTVFGICVGILGIFGAINPAGISLVFVDGSKNDLGRIVVALGSLIIIASSAALLWFAPYLDRALDRSLLPPARSVALQAEVTELDRARMAGIDAAAAERRRIERDLHDGAQPRLVALTMTLVMAKAKIDSDPERAKELVAEAHSEAKGIVTELRQLARGIHPAVLTDRGLDAAVSALAGRSPIPVEVEVGLEGRIEREAEAVAYFVVAECLTNIAKHSGASRAKVVIAPTAAGVEIVVTDNGRGGARVDRAGTHTGLAGLVDRVEAARGTLNLTSPAGGPTTVVVEVPCAS